MLLLRGRRRRQIDCVAQIRLRLSRPWRYRTDLAMVLPAELFEGAGLRIF